MVQVKRWASWHTAYSNGSDGGIWIEYDDGKTESMQYQAVYGDYSTKRRDTTERQACAIAASHLPQTKEIPWTKSMDQGRVTHDGRILHAAWREQCDYELSK